MGAEGSAASATIAGMRVRAVRELGGRSRHEVARASGLTRRDLANVERGTRPLTPDEAVSLASALAVEPDAFLAPDELVPVPDELIDEAATQEPSPFTSERLALTHGEFDDVLAACERVCNAQSDVDMRALIRELEVTVRSASSPTPR